MQPSLDDQQRAARALVCWQLQLDLAESQLGSNVLLQSSKAGQDRQQMSQN